jgi:hypothetical protein
MKKYQPLKKPTIQRPAEIDLGHFEDSCISPYIRGIFAELDGNWQARKFDWTEKDSTGNRKRR